MASSVAMMICIALILGPIIYFLLHLIQGIKGLRRRTDAVLQWPGPQPRHWFWGTLPLVSVVTSQYINYDIRMKAIKNNLHVKVYDIYLHGSELPGLIQLSQCNG